MRQPETTSKQNDQADRLQRIQGALKDFYAKSLADAKSGRIDRYQRRKAQRRR